MGAKNTVYLISGGTTPLSTSGGRYYLSGGAGTQTPYSGSGTPWTSEATTPYELSLNDVTGGIWVPQPAPAQLQYSGGPPFVSGRYPIYQSYDNQTSTVGVQLRATNRDNAIYLLRLLRQVLNTALYSGPCVLAIQGGTNTTYYEIYAADVNENALYLKEPEGVWRATMTWTVSPHGTKASLDTLLNAVTFTNAPTGGNNNFQGLGALDGDLAASAIGQPLAITLDTPAVVTSGVLAAYVAIAKNRDTASSAATINTTSTSGIDIDSQSSTFAGGSLPSIASGGEATAVRFAVRMTSPSANLQIRAVARIGDGNGQTIMTSRWITPEPVAAPYSVYVDLGYVRMPHNYRRGISYLFNCLLQARSTNGAAATATVNYFEFIEYYTWMRINGSFLNSTYQLELKGALDNYGVVREVTPPAIYFVNSAGSQQPLGGIQTSGSFPRAYAGAGLYLAWTFGGAHDTSARFDDVTVKHAPLYQTVRGGG